MKHLNNIHKPHSSLFPFVRIDADGHAFFNFAGEEAKKHFHLIKKIKSKKRSHSDEITEQWLQVELHDAQRALELLGKYYALFTDRVEQMERKVIHVTIAKSDI